MEEEYMILVLVVMGVCWILAAIANSVMDTLDHHQSTSIFSNEKIFKNQQFWNVSQGWRNKWKNGNKEEGEKFWGSSTIFVWTTDAWHLFQHIMLTFIQLSIALPLVYFTNYSLWWLIPVIAILKIGWGGPFELFYKYIWITKKK